MTPVTPVRPAPALQERGLQTFLRPPWRKMRASPPRGPARPTGRGALWKGAFPYQASCLPGSMECEPRKLQPCAHVCVHVHICVCVRTCAHVCMLYMCACMYVFSF